MGTTIRGYKLKEADARGERFKNNEKDLLNNGDILSVTRPDIIEDIHRRIYENASALIRAGKLASPITLKTYLGDADLGGVSAAQYLARLAAEATPIINA